MPAAMPDSGSAILLFMITVDLNDVLDCRVVEIIDPCSNHSLLA